MKKIALALFFLAIGMAPAFSQISKGQWLVGGSASVDFSKQGDDDAILSAHGDITIAYRVRLPETFVVG